MHWLLVTKADGRAPLYFHKLIKINTGHVIFHTKSTNWMLCTRADLLRPPLLRPRITLDARARRNFFFLISYMIFFNICARKRFYFLVEWVRFGIGSSSRPRVNFFSLVCSNPPGRYGFICILVCFPTVIFSPFAWKFDIDVAAIWGLTMERARKKRSFAWSGVSGRKKRETKLHQVPWRGCR